MNWNKFILATLKDLIISFTITYFVLLIPEIILPGLVSSHFSLKYLLTFILLLGLAYSLINSKQTPSEVNLKFRAISKNILNILLFLIFTMLLLSLYKMKFWEVILLSALSLLIFISLENVLFPAKNSNISDQKP